MDADAVNRELSDSWVSSIDGEDIVAEHESGVQLQIVSDDLDSQIICNIINPIVVASVYIEAITDVAIYADPRHALAGISTLAKEVEAGEYDIEPIAVLPHDGDPESIDVSIHMDDSRLESRLTEQPFCDVVFVRPLQVPDIIDVDEFDAVSEELLSFVYGHTTDIPDVLEELESKNYAYGEATIEITTVTETDISDNIPEDI